MSWSFMEYHGVSGVLWSVMECRHSMTLHIIIIIYSISIISMLYVRPHKPIYVRPHKPSFRPRPLLLSSVVRRRSLLHTAHPRDPATTMTTKTTMMGTMMVTMTIRQNYDGNDSYIITVLRFDDDNKCPIL